MEKVENLNESLDSAGISNNKEVQIGAFALSDNLDDYMSDCGWALDENGNLKDFNKIEDI